MYGLIFLVMIIFFLLTFRRELEISSMRLELEDLNVSIDSWSKDKVTFS